MKLAVAPIEQSQFVTEFKQDIQDDTQKDPVEQKHIKSSIQLDSASNRKCLFQKSTVKISFEGEELCIDSPTDELKSADL